MSSAEWMYLTHSGSCDNYCLLINGQSRKTSSSGRLSREKVNDINDFSSMMSEALSGRSSKEGRNWCAVVNMSHSIRSIGLESILRNQSAFWDTIQYALYHRCLNEWAKTEYVSSNIWKIFIFKGKCTLTLKTSN